MRSLLPLAEVITEVDIAFHSASGMMLCSGYTPSGTSASSLYDGMRRALSATSLASSGTQVRPMFHEKKCIKFTLSR